MAIGRPIVNKGELYINNINLAHVDDENITVAAGSCRDSSNLNDIVLSADVNLDVATNGAGGLDTGSMANSTMYAVYAIGNSFNSAAYSAIASADLDEPGMPADYDMYRRVGYFLSDGTADILAFYQIGNGNDRWMYYDVSIASDITAGASAAYADVDLTGSVPLINTIVDVDCTFTPTAGNDELVLVPNGSTSANGVARMSGSAAGVIKIGHMLCPCMGDATLEYKVTGSATALNVQGYLDSL
jgi:hypothetical protein